MSESGYSPNESRPLKGYSLAMTVYGALVGLFGLVVVKRDKRLPQRIEPYDLALIGVATHKASRLIAKDAVTTPLRAPFTRYEEPAGAGEVNEEVREKGGVKHAVGEMISCPFCLAMWIATGLVAGIVAKPKPTRLAASALSAVAISDALQFGYDALKKIEK